MDSIDKKSKPATIPQVPLDRLTQVLTREQLNEAAVEEYKSFILEGIELDPVRVFQPPGSQTLFLATGHHRLEAHRRAGRTHIAATIEPGDRWAAYQAGVADNLKHGVKLTLADRKKNAREFLKQVPDWSTGLIAKSVGLSSPTVEAIRKEMASTYEVLELEKRVGADGRVRSLPKKIVRPADAPAVPNGDDEYTSPPSRTSAQDMIGRDEGLLSSPDIATCSEAARGLERQDTEQTQLSTVLSPSSSISESRAVVTTASPESADKESAGGDRDKYLREAKAALGRLNRMVDLLNLECKGGAEHQACRRSLDTIAKSLDAWPTISHGVAA